MSWEWLVYPILIFVFGLLVLKTIGHIEERKAQIKAASEEAKARVYADQRSNQARMDGLIDLRVEALRGGAGPDSELDQAMQMLGMIVPGIMPGTQSEPGQNQEQPTESDLIQFSKTDKGKQAMQDFKEWKLNG